MTRIQPLFSLARPLVAPRRAACQQLLRFSTASRLRVEDSSKPSQASRTSPKAPSNPQEASRAADLAAAEAVTDADSAQAPAPKPTLPSKRSKTSEPSTHDAEPLPTSSMGGTETTKPTKTKTFNTSSKARDPTKARFSKRSTIELPPPKYHVARSTSKNLPIYTDYKRGGNLHLTTIRKITGDLSALRDELRVFLNKKNEDVKVNSLTQHVIVKGHHVSEITEFLRTRGM